MPVTLQDGLIGTDPLHALVVGLLLLAVTVPLAIRLGREQERPWLTTIVLVSFAAHMAGSALQVVIVRTFYANVADFNLYDGQGAALLDAWKSGSFPLQGLEIPGTGSVSILTGAVYGVVGVDQLGGFFVFSWFGLVGLMAAYRAFRLMLPEGNDTFYAVLIFLMPSLFYWPSVAGKEAVMLLALGWMALGAARVFTGDHLRALRVAVPGVVLGSFIRPHEVALLFGAFCTAVVLQRARRPSLVSPLRKALTVIVLGALGVVMLQVTASFLGITSFSPSGLAAAVNQAHAATQGEGVGFDSSHATWNPSPLYYPQDIYLVLFKPLPYEASGVTQATASIENVLVLGIVLYCWRSWASVPRQLRSPYVVMSVVYSASFLYIFAALGNVGLLVRERTMLFPMLFVLFALPRRLKKPPPRRPAIEVPVAVTGTARAAAARSG